MKRFKKLLLIFLCALVLFIAILTIYLNVVFFPVKFKAIALQRLKNQTGKDIRIEDIRYNFFRGIVINKLLINETAQGHLIISADEVSFNFLILPFLRERKIIIPAVRIKNPKVNLELHKNGQLNITSLLKGKAEKKEPRLTPGFYKIDIINATINFKDKSLSPYFEASLENLNINARFGLGPKLKFYAQARIPNTIPKTSFFLKGSYDFTHKLLQAQIKPEQLKISIFSAYLNNLPIKDGYIKGISLGLDFSSDRVITASCNIKIEELLLAKAENAPSANLGKIDIHLNIIKGKKEKNWKYQGAAFIKDATIALPGLDKLQNPDTELKFSKQQLSWRAKLIFQNKTFDSNGTITNFRPPQIKAQIKGAGLDLEADFTLKKKNVLINSVKGNYLNNTFYTYGSLNTEDPRLLIGEFFLKTELSLGDLGNMLPGRFKEITTRMKPRGTCYIQGTVQGNLKNWRNLNWELMINSDKISIYNLKLHNLNLPLTQQNGLLNIGSSSISAYSGSIKFAAHTQLDAGQMPFSLKAHLDNIDLFRLKQEFSGWREKSTSGKLSADILLKGDLLKFSNLQGNASVIVKEGILGELKLAKRLSEVLFLPELINITFTEGNADFLIKDKKISTENLSLKSRQVMLTCIGNLGFDGGLDFRITAQAYKRIPSDIKGIKDIPAMILAEAGKVLSVRLTGSLKEPRFRLAPKVPRIPEAIKKLKDIFFGK
jgi:hypothetical protein